MSAMSDADAPDLRRRALVEVAASQPASVKDPVIRRYRLARVPRHTTPAPLPDRFAHLRRSYD